MDRDEQLLKMLKELAQYEIDGTFIIAQGISCLVDKDKRDKLTEIMKEYEQNIKLISDTIVRYGGDVPEHSRDFKGFFMQGYVGMRGLISDNGVMNALSQNTKMVVNTFEKALKEDMPDDVRKPLQKVFEKAKQHCDYFTAESNKKS